MVYLKDAVITKTIVYSLYPYKINWVLKDVVTPVGIDPGVGDKPESVLQPITESYTGDFRSKNKLSYLLCFVCFIKQ
jgi:hypothetical protein